MRFEGLSLFLKVLNYPTEQVKTKKTEFGDCLTNLRVTKRFQPAIYTYFHEESESEVQNTQIMQENLKQSISNFQIFIFKPDRGVSSALQAFKGTI